MESSMSISKNATSLPVLVTCPLDLNVSYTCSNPYPNCTNPLGFQFSSLWTISQNIYSACTSDWRLFDPQSPALTQAGCEQIVGSDDWTKYPGADVWARLTTWKFPLLQLVATFPRPPLTFSSEVFVILHLLGDPIGTIKDLLLKIASCEDRAISWVHFQSDLRPLVPDEPQVRYPESVRIWKAMATIADSYDEWGQDKGNLATEFMKERLSSDELSCKDKLLFIELAQQTSNALAADRSTKFLPISVAQAFFIGAVAIAFGRTQDAATVNNPTTFINIETHSIAFTALYFWVIPAVFLGSLIGVSQTENAIPRILRRFQADLDHKFPSWTIKLPSDHLVTPAGQDWPNTTLRERSGGLYSWQPEEARKAVKRQISRPKTQVVPAVVPSTVWGQYVNKIRSWLLLRPGSVVFALIIVTLGTLTGVLISILVPPIGFGCRSVGELAIYAGWLLSASLDYIPRHNNFRWHFWFIFIKDLLATVATMGGIVTTQFGVFNRCSCYTMSGKTGLALPEITFVAGTLSHRIETVYPAIAFLCVGFQLIAVPYIVQAQYPHATRVFLSRDDNASNMKLWHTVRNDFSRQDGSIFRRSARSLGTIFSWSTPNRIAPLPSDPHHLSDVEPVAISSNQRTRTSAMESGEVNIQPQQDDEQYRLLQRAQYDH